MTIEALRTHQTENAAPWYYGFAELEEALRAIHGAASTLIELGCRSGPGESMFAFLGEHLEAQHDRACEAFESLAAVLREKTGNEK